MRYRCHTCGTEWARWSEAGTKRHTAETGHGRYDAIMEDR